MAACAAIPGLQLAWLADNDPTAAALAAHRFPEVVNLGDITVADWSTVEPVDVLTAGFPCQPISNAGRKRGQYDERWIWPAVAHAVRTVRPRLVVLENVSVLRLRGFGEVITDLAAHGYDAAWVCLRASDVGAPHRRDRLFVVAHAVRGRRQGRSVPPPGGGGRLEQDAHRPVGIQRGLATSGETEGRRTRPDARGRGGTPVADAENDGCERCGNTRGWWLGSEDDGGAFADAEGVGWHEGFTEPARQLRGSHVAVSGGTDWGQYGTAVRRWESILGRAAPPPIEPGRNGFRLAPRFAEWMMGIPTGWVTDVPGLARNAQFKLIGNGVVPQQGMAAIKYLMDVNLWQLGSRPRSGPTPRIRRSRAATVAPTRSR